MACCPLTTRMVWRVFCFGIAVGIEVISISWYAQRVYESTVLAKFCILSNLELNGIKQKAEEL
jgi:hypothetical protein